MKIIFFINRIMDKVTLVILLLQVLVIFKLNLIKVKLFFKFYYLVMRQLNLAMNQ
jgi:hypothetical protein